tara:strand:- start:3418 stop:3969 length:552 start_codon:yes stop_codon:yes gene_type:complete
MPLFQSRRDSGFLKGINKELLHSFISIEVGVYKLDLVATETNIYEESEQRSYKPPIRLFCQLRLDEKSSVGDDYSIDYSKTAAFGFLKSDLRDAGLIMEEGDIIFYDNGYYETDQISNSNYWGGRNPNTMIGIVEDNWPIHGYDHAVVAECHLTRTNSIHVVDSRTGQIPSPINIQSSIPKFL